MGKAPDDLRFEWRWWRSCPVCPNRHAMLQCGLKTRCAMSRPEQLQQNSSLLDHLVGASEQHRGHVETERLGRLQIDHQLLFGRLLHRKVCRLLTLEDAIDVSGRLPKLIRKIGPVGNQTAILDEGGCEVDRRKLVSGGKPDDQLTV